MKLHVRYATRHLFSLCLFTLVCLTAHAVELERFSLEEWRAETRKRVLAGGRVTDFRQEYEEWLGSKGRLEPEDLVALLDHPVVAMAAAQAELPETVKCHSQNPECLPTTFMCHSENLECSLQTFKCQCQNCHRLPTTVKCR